MSPWRARARRFVFRKRLFLLIGEYALEAVLVLWSITVGLNVATNKSPSVSLQALPDGLETVWAVLMMIAGVTVAFGIVSQRHGTMASGMYLFATTLMAFAAAVIGASTWDRAGATASLFFLVGCASLLRGWWLKEQESALIKEIVRTRRKET